MQSSEAEIKISRCWELGMSFRDQTSAHLQSIQRRVMRPNGFLELAQGQNDTVLWSPCFWRTNWISLLLLLGSVMGWGGEYNRGEHPPGDLVNASSKYNLLLQTGEPREMKETTLKTWWKLPRGSLCHTWALGSWGFYFFPFSSVNKPKPSILHFGVKGWEDPSASPPKKAHTRVRVCLHVKDAPCCCPGCEPRTWEKLPDERDSGSWFSLACLGLPAAASSGGNKSICLGSSLLNAGLGPNRQLLLTPGSPGVLRWGWVTPRGKGQCQHTPGVHPTAHDAGKGRKGANPQTLHCFNPVVNSLQQRQS